MTATIDYYLTATSPWTYLGHDLFVDIARRHGAAIRWRPMNLGAVFGETGGLPLPKRAPARQRYRMVELQRWRERRGLPLNLQPAHFPADASLADCCAIALDESGADPAAFYAAVQRAVWVGERDIAETAIVEELLREAGHPAADVVERARSNEVGARYEAYTREAIGADVFGAPTYVLNGEAFWGQDRLDLLEDALSSGRQPYRP